MVRPLVAAAFSLLIASPAALAADARQMEENKKIVAAFYDAALNQKDFEKASQYLGARIPSTIRWRPTAAKASRASSPS
jgi:hypothetical protein